jgi:hypothetical protein
VRKRHWPLRSPSRTVRVGICRTVAVLSPKGSRAGGVRGRGPSRIRAARSSIPAASARRAFMDSAPNRVADVKFRAGWDCSALAKQGDSRCPPSRINRRRIGIERRIRSGGYTTLSPSWPKTLPLVRAGVALAPAVLANVGLGLTGHVRPGRPSCDGRASGGLAHAHTRTGRAGPRSGSSTARASSSRRPQRRGHCAIRGRACIPGACGIRAASRRRCRSRRTPHRRWTLRYAVPFACSG